MNHSNVRAGPSRRVTKYVPPESGMSPMLMNAGMKVARAGEGQPRAGGRAVDRGDHRFLELADRADVGVIRRLQPLADVPGRLPELRQVLADTESASGTGDDNSADVVSGGLLQRRLQRRVHVGVQRVQHIGTVESDRQNGAVATRLYLGHARTLADRVALFAAASLA